mmetsp:Transcript_14021/g.31768  ORF Transcript_14021/g.31768 Transcript_14021/m.31768 type:complete len:203 (-) Transcript_14021:12-620(-)
MIHLENAETTNPTMMTPVWLVLQAPLAVSPFASCLLSLREAGAEFLQAPACVLFRLCLQLPSDSIWYVARVRKDAPRQRIEQQRCDNVKQSQLLVSLDNQILLARGVWEIKLQEPPSMQEDVLCVQDDHNKQDASHRHHLTEFAKLRTTTMPRIWMHRLMHLQAGAGIGTLAQELTEGLAFVYVLLRKGRPEMLGLRHDAAT